MDLSGEGGGGVEEIEGYLTVGGLYKCITPLRTQGNPSPFRIVAASGFRRQKFILQLGLQTWLDTWV